jgi:hypothetical protein
VASHIIDERFFSVGLTPREVCDLAREALHDDPVYRAHDVIWRQRREERVARRIAAATEPTMVPFLANKTWPAPQRIRPARPAAGLGV